MRPAHTCPLLLVAFAPLGTATMAFGQSPAGAANEVRLEQVPGQIVPLDLTFRDESGAFVSLATYFGRVPVIIVPVYYRCPMLCTQVLNSLVRVAKQVSLDTGTDYQIVIVSIDPRETPTLAAQKKLQYLKQYKRPFASRGWHFLTGDEEHIRALADAIGYKYIYVPQRDEYAHPAAMVIVARDGIINRYLLGLDIGPRDFRLALVETADGRIGGIVDRLLLRCFTYDPATGRYGLAIITAVRAGGVLTLFGLVGSICIFRRRMVHQRPTDVRL